MDTRRSIRQGEILKDTGRSKGTRGGPEDKKGRSNGGDSKGKIQGRIFQNTKVQGKRSKGNIKGGPERGRRRGGQMRGWSRERKTNPNLVLRNQNGLKHKPELV